MVLVRGRPDAAAALSAVEFGSGHKVPPGVRRASLGVFSLRGRLRTVAPCPSVSRTARVPPAYRARTSGIRGYASALGRCGIWQDGGACWTYSTVPTTVVRRMEGSKIDAVRGENDASMRRLLCWAR